MRPSTSVVIGTDDGVQSWHDVGDALNAKYFFADPVVYSHYNYYYPYETASANRSFIMDAVFNGENIYCSHNPLDYYIPSSDTIRVGCTLAKELQMIE